MGYHVVLENSAGCELDGRFAANEDEIKGAVQTLVDECVLAPGDVIRVVEVIGRQPTTFERAVGRG